MGIKVGNTDFSNIYIYVNEIVHVTGVTLNKSSIFLTTPNQTEQLVATITPANADDQTVIWSSSNTSIATVDQNGLVTCVTPGSCTITATTNDGGYTATCNVAPAQLYQYIKMEITATRGMPGVTQFSEFEFCDSNDVAMSRPAGTTISSTYPGTSPSEGIDMLIDGSVYTKYCTIHNPPMDIVITLGSPVDFSVYNKYRRYTANDAPDRDPITWKLYLSNDNSTWVEVSSVVSASITTGRETLAGTWTI